jgi:hypothetical protein
MRRLALIFAFVVAGLCACAGDDPARITPDPIENPAETIQALADAYRAKDFPAFEALLAEDYTFFLNEPDPDTGETQYDRVTELRIHQRMFDPQTIPPGDPPPVARWLEAVSITLTSQTQFAERPDLYTNATPPGPLDPGRWIASEAAYAADAFLQLQGETDFQVRGRCNFVVLEDRTKAIGDLGKFTLYQWVDVDGAATSYRRFILGRW